MTVVVAGSVNMDLVVTLPVFPETGQTIRGQSFTAIPGGKGLNQAIAASRVGSHTVLVGAIGNDDYSKTLIEALEIDQIDTSNLQHYQGPCGVALIEVNSRGENRIAIVPGANGLLDAKEIKKEMFVNLNEGVLVGPLENPLSELEEIYVFAKENDLTTILNPAPAQPLSSRLLNAVDILIPNQHEAELLTGIKISSVLDAEISCKKLLEAGPRAVIVTLGDQGSVYVSKSETIYQSAFRVEARDTTAAGDTFCGALAAQLDQKKTIRQALKFASAAASLSTLTFGASSSIPTQENTLDFISRSIS